MRHDPPFTLARFEALLREGERWIELDAGRLIRHDPPDVVHGNVVRNISRALAAQIRQQPDLVACFDLGLVLKQSPATVYCPAISGFPLPAGFMESDKLLTESVPRLIVEIASTNDRRANLAARCEAYEAHGVRSLWVFDPIARQAHVFVSGEPGRLIRTGETFRDPLTLPGFQLPVADVFADPAWWSAQPGRS